MLFDCWKSKASEGASKELLKLLVSCYVHTKQYDRAEKICDTQMKAAVVPKG